MCHVAKRVPIPQHLCSPPQNCLSYFFCSVLCHCSFILTVLADPLIGVFFAEEKSHRFAYDPCHFLGKMLINSFPLVDFSIWLALSIDEWVMTHYLPQSAAQGTSHLPPIWFPLSKSSSQGKRREAGSEKARAASNQIVGMQLASSINRIVILLVSLWH